MRLITSLTYAPATITSLLAGLVIAIGGCREQVEPVPTQDQPQAVSRPVRVIVVDDAAFTEVLERQWAARTETKLELTQTSAADLETAEQLSGDVIIYPSVLLGTLAERQLIGAPTASVIQSAEFNASDVFDTQRHAEVRWGEQTMAFSFGSPQLLLMYRADLFNQLRLEPPATWDAYQQLLALLSRAELGDLAPAEDQAWTPACEPLAPGWAGKILLARAAAYASHPSQFSVLFDYVTMEPLIGGPPFVRALEELVAAAQQSPADAQQVTPETARQKLFAGEAAMVLSWSSHAHEGPDPLVLADGVEIGFAELPGATSAYNFSEQVWTPLNRAEPTRVPLIAVAGKLGSVGRNARRPREAAGLLALLTGQQWSELLSPVSPATTLFRKSHLKKTALWTDEALSPTTSEQYATLVSTVQNRPMVTSCLRIPGWQRYMESLDRAVQAACNGERSAAEALAQTAADWAAITNELGVDSQRVAYTHSLGLEP